MKSALCCSLLVVLGIVVLGSPAGAASLPNFAYAETATCLNSTSGFNSKFEPNTAGTAWTETFNGVGSGTVSGSTSTVTQFDRSVIAAVFGVESGSHVPAASAITTNIATTVSGPNSDGSFTLTPTAWSGSITAGPLSGLTFSATTSGLQVKVWVTTPKSGGFGVNLNAATGTPVVQTITLSNKTKFERICTTSFVSSSPVQ